MYSQRDPRWENVRLGTSTRTIGQDGCLVCCIAELLRWAGNPLDPAQLNRWLTLNHGFTDGNRFIFGSVEKLGAPLKSLYDWRTMSANVPLLRAVHGEGLGIVLEVNFRPYGRFASHWVLVSDFGERNRVSDPWMPPECQNGDVDLLATYAKYTQGLEQAIYRAALYEVEEIPF